MGSRAVLALEELAAALSSVVRVFELRARSEGANGTRGNQRNTKGREKRRILGWGLLHATEG
jgi:hypothetical protein